MKPITSIGQTTMRWLTVALLSASFTACSHAGEPTSPKDRLAKAQAMFAERCKTAGEKIVRTVDNVEGIYVLKLRPVGASYANQFALTDPYGDDLLGDGYLESFLQGSYQPGVKRRVVPGWPPRIGYQFVEAIDPKDGKRYHYTGRLEEPWQYNKAYLKGHIRFLMDKTPATGEPPRYGVTYDDISTHEEREYWIAGSSLKVIDLQTNEVIAERVGYMVDPGQGARGGGRAPWQMAADHACPDFHRFAHPVVVTPGSSEQARQAQDFVEKVLKPIQGK